MSVMNQSLNARYDFLFKILTIGNTGVGKSCLIMRYTENAFSTRFINTIGVELKSKTISLQHKSIRLQLWDTAGQERFRTLTSSYYRGSHGIAIVFDITDRSSFSNVSSWLGEIERYASSEVFKIIIGNKLDLEDRRMVTTAEAKALAESYRVPYFEASAKDARGVSDMFAALVEVILRAEEEKQGCLLPRNSFMLSDASIGESHAGKSQRKKCCEGN